ncbi:MULTISPECIES: histidine phosphatase family protein [Pseudomonas]|uniref:histidine phosphatase family protein n=1 Tax=Pseudomonas TaxID=286 RepID=UPI0011A3128B|nr:histidine phosphatase family protein [Pseudomonas sp. URMO17WK12:I11]MBI6924458.1 histidine phosphatase family protein [Pseudomonas putida]
MKTTRLTLICHGLTLAQKRGYFAKPEDTLVSVPYCSQLQGGFQLLTAPEQRAQQTALALGEAMITSGLADCDMGLWQGLPLKRLQAEQPLALADWLRNPASEVHGGESFQTLCQRMSAWLEEFDQPGEWTAVTHPMVMRAVLVQVLGCPMTAGQRIDVLPLSRIDLSFSGQWRLRINCPQNASL